MKRYLLLLIAIIMLTVAGCVKNISGGSDATPTGPAKTVYFTSAPASASPAPEPATPVPEQKLTFRAAVISVRDDKMTTVAALNESAFEVVHLDKGYDDTVLDFTPSIGQFVEITIAPGYRLEGRDIWYPKITDAKLISPGFPAQYIPEYINTGNYMSNPMFNVTIASKQDLDAFYESYKSHFYNDSPRFIAAAEKYDDDFFSSKFIVVTAVSEGSIGDSHVVTAVDGDSITINRILPTCDKAGAVGTWIIIVELDRDKNEVKQYRLNFSPPFPYRDPP